MNVRLISKSVGACEELYGKSMGEILAYVARVSNPGNQNNFLTSPKLLTYCLRQGHVSVFECCSLAMAITTSRAIGEQLLRHRSFCFQVFSQRYAEVTDFEKCEARRQDDKNRQNSIDDLGEVDKLWFDTIQTEVNEFCSLYYQEALSRGIAKECSRNLLPLSSETTIYMTGNVRSWLHYCSVRTDESVQKEHRDIAHSCKHILLQEVPELSDYFETLRKDQK